ncbi:hypothetical protein GTY70_05895 [Stenotrophomonas maltophilia]|uniref:hypothetical protein n=1 Tax=Stenotrophomonas pavanii TaxID=487698 RepID=UPI001F28ADD6|nr:hypothetical protein [Stenotrophomonas pavanii]MCF3463414.1 hypothetical protein [Stenotrophomonas maltophilia]MCF3507931.1 hypothetical protein [Stenotrophomonas maltophilia]MCU1155808.1 hypothetical protein [Stenotrophomonas maltophilia]MCU1166999.1 hypothetical protein [Stenotrophomonas maltophilia]MCU1213289.1 hypothetical protein [Stenotrophomonas maltophilia]
MASKGGLWSEDSLVETVSGYLGNGYDQNLPAFRQFCHAAAKIIQRRRAREDNTLLQGAVIFVMEGIVPISDLQKESRPLFNHGVASIDGRVWTGSSRLATATGIALPQGGAADRVNFVVEKLGMGSRPAIYYDASEEEAVMRAYPAGLEQPDNCEDLSLNSAEFTIEHLKRLLDHAHAKLLISPSGSNLARNLWSDRQAIIPIGDAEKGVQDILHVALTTGLGFGSIAVRAEGSSEMGRYDFFLEEQDPLNASTWTHHAIIELKVLKSFSEAGSPVADAKNIKAVSDGLTQAAAYRDSHYCRFAALCCYDMRTAPDPEGAVAHERKRAAHLDVAMWSWPLYPSAKLAREALVN